MKILRANAGVLTNSEVLGVLADRGCGGNLPNSRSLACEKMVYSHLLEHSAGRRSSEELGAFMEALAQFDLTRIEQLQLINLLPGSLVEVHLIVEQCEERLAEEQVEKLLELVQTHLALPKEAAGETQEA
jgi:DNA-directed RNA polymerase subunit F